MNTCAMDIVRSGEFSPQLLVDAYRGAKILGISVSHFYQFMRRNDSIQTITIGTMQMWRRKDLLRLTGAKNALPQKAEDVLIDAQTIASLCSISRSMVYKLNDLGMMPKPILDGRTLRWSMEVIEEWIDAGCPKQVTGKRHSSVARK